MIVKIHSEGAFLHEDTTVTIFQPADSFWEKNSPSVDDDKDYSSVYLTSKYILNKNIAKMYVSCIILEGSIATLLKMKVFLP